MLAIWTGSPLKSTLPQSGSSTAMRQHWVSALVRQIQPQTGKFMTQSVHDTGPAKGPLDAAQKIVVELQGMTKDQQALALKFATETLGLQMSTAYAQVTHAPVHASNVASPAAPVAPGQRTDIKTFTAIKAPKSDQQFAAVVAYYYQFEAPAAQRKDSIDAATMKDAARQAGRKQVNDWGITLSNALRTGYLDKADRGAFKLNSVGENLVAITLPDNSASGKGNGGGSNKRRRTKKKLTGKKKVKKG
jgi:hypothetical protein